MHLQAEEVRSFRQCAHGHQPARRCELQRVGKIVVEHLLQAGRVENHPLDGGIDGDLDAHLLFRCRGAQDCADFADRLYQIDRFRPELEFPRLHLRQVENVVDQAQQVATAGQDVPEEIALLAAHPAHFSVMEQLREAEDGVQRRAQLVRHVGEELRLVGAGPGQLLRLLL